MQNLNNHEEQDVHVWNWILMCCIPIPEYVTYALWHIIKPNDISHISLPIISLETLK